MKIGIVGNGTVGHATARCFMEFADVRVWDDKPEKRTHNIVDVFNVDFLFVCTPEDRVSDVVHSCANSKNIVHQPKAVVIKSTVPIGTTRTLYYKHKLHTLVHSPEFLTERCSVADAMVPARMIVGSPKTFDTAARALEDLYGARFPGTQVLCMSSDESEAVKLFCNAFFATKVAFFNEIRQIALAYNCTWDAVLQGMLSDGRIGATHTRVPGPDGKLGFGGKCLPKDLAMLPKGSLFDAVMKWCNLDTGLASSPNSQESVPPEHC